MGPGPAGRCPPPLLPLLRCSPRAPSPNVPAGSCAACLIVPQCEPFDKRSCSLAQSTAEVCSRPKEPCAPRSPSSPLPPSSVCTLSDFVLALVDMNLEFSLQIFDACCCRLRVASGRWNPPRKTKSRNREKPSVKEYKATNCGGKM